MILLSGHLAQVAAWATPVHGQSATSPTDKLKSRFAALREKFASCRAASNKNGYLALARPLR
jgi:hypothetical protein